MTDKSIIKEEVKIPSGITITKNGTALEVKGPKGSLSRDFPNPTVQVTVNNGLVEILCTGTTPHKEDKALMGTYKAHLRNMIKGVTTGYQFTMKTVYSHFPIKTTVEGDQLLIQNFLGERFPRKAYILPGVKVDTKGDSVTVSGISKDDVGQTAANIERATKVKNRDIRVFQDGVYTVKRG
jgi:large subunit ribosomal protein L6